MKNIFLKLIAFCVLLIASANIAAQTVTIPVGIDKSSVFVTQDYTLTNTTSRCFIIPASMEGAATQDLVINIDSLTGNHTNVAVSFWGKKSSLSPDSTQIGNTINWKGTTRDTTITISNASANRFNTYTLKLTGTGTGTTKIDSWFLKLYVN